MSEEIKNVTEELQNEAPVQKETKKAVLNASVAPEDFDWDAFENEGVEKGSKEETWPSTSRPSPRSPRTRSWKVWSPPLTSVRSW